MRIRKTNQVGLGITIIGLIMTGLLVGVPDARAQQAGKLVEDWLVLGSFEVDSVQHTFENTYLKGEPFLFPDQGETHEVSGFQWKKHSVEESGILQLKQIKLPMYNYCVSYAATYIYSPENQLMKMYLGSDDGIGAWVNGVNVHKHVVYRGVDRRQDETTVRLSKGWNVLLLKIFNTDGGYGFAAEFLTQDGEVPQDLKFSTQRPQNFAGVEQAPFPFLGEVNLLASQVIRGSGSRVYPLTVEVSNLGKVSEQQGSVRVSDASGTLSETSFPLQRKSAITLQLTPEDLHKMLQAPVNITVYYQGEKYNSLQYQATPTDVITSLYSSPDLSDEISGHRKLYANLRENINWYEYFTDSVFTPEKGSLQSIAETILEGNYVEATDQLNAQFEPVINYAREIKQDTLHLMGQSHIDIAWKWTWKHSLDVVRNTYTAALNFMDSIPEYEYIQSQAQTFKWMEERNPELFQRIKKKVEDGQFHLTGGMWVEPDMYLPSGESLVRQALYGQEYFRKKFGVRSEVGYAPDTFGYTWTLPQILRKSDMHYFVTEKLRHNDTTKFPHHIFWWVGQDSSTVLTILPRNKNSALKTDRIAREYREFKSQGFGDLPVLYGVGDHGGGPTIRHFENAEKMEQIAVYPATKHNDIATYSHMVEDKYTGLPTWHDELYLQWHRGTYTTWGRIKKRNRQSEIWLEEAEKLAAYSDMDYPKQELEQAWKNTLFNQMHDILPGSAIPPSYKDAHEFYDKVEQTTQSVIKSGMSSLVQNVNTHGPGTPVLVFNPLSWERNDVVKVPVPEGMNQVDGIVDWGRKAEYFQIRNDTVSFYATGVPENGYKVFWLQENGQPMGPNPIEVTRTTMENEMFRVKINPENGNITEFYDKRHGRQVLEPGKSGNVLQFHEDERTPKDAWDITYTGKSWECDSVTSIEVMEEGPLRGVLRVTRIWGNSRFVQDYTIYSNEPRLDIRTRAHWDERHITLKTLFPANVHAEATTYDIAYGTIQRPTNPQTPAEKAKWEVPAHFYADLSTSEYGVSLMNDSKYGYDVKGNRMRLTLLRSPTTPDPIDMPPDYENPYAGLGHQEFTYAIYPHNGGHNKGEVKRRAYELNYPMLTQLTHRHPGRMQVEHSFITVNSDHVMVRAVKEAESSSSIILRLLETRGEPAEIDLWVDKEFERAWLTNLLEDRQRQLTVHGQSVQVELEPYEIVTVELERK